MRWTSRRAVFFQSFTTFAVSLLSMACWSMLPTIGSRLCDIGVLQADFARELSQTFRFLLTLRLDGQLAALAGTSGTLLRAVIPFQYGTG